jgi:hypothetical protein
MDPAIVQLIAVVLGGLIAMAGGVVTAPRQRLANYSKCRIVLR